MICTPDQRLIPVLLPKLNQLGIGLHLLFLQKMNDSKRLPTQSCSTYIAYEWADLSFKGWNAKWLFF